MISDRARHQPVIWFIPVVQAIFSLPLSAVFHKIREHCVCQRFTVFIQLIDIIDIVRNKRTRCYIAMPVNIGISAASAVRDATSR